MPNAPAVSCAMIVIERTRVTTSTPASPGIPARNGFNGFLRALLGDRALLPPSSADMSCLSPVGPTQLRKLDASVGASGPRDFATSLVRTLGDCSQAETCPAIHRAQNAAASTASRAASVTIAIRPLCGRGAKSSRDDLGCTETGIFLQRGLDCPNHIDKSQQLNLLLTRLARQYVSHTLL